ncbi:MAG: phosphoribosylglycinamide formyltransferase [Oscillospiraceae bacterium]|jgi:phosphoribosylglycinamide formyltransferase-1|nr:phosphoribosylglycinamide formyltransferase [Oscillospiraceae bacterium]
MKKHESKINIAVLVSGSGTNLQAIIDAQEKGILRHGEVKIVISNKKDAYAVNRAKKHSIKAETVIKEGQNSQDIFENSIKKILRENDIHLIVLAGFTNILSQKFTSEYKNKIINVHPSLIPSFCGKGFYGIKVHEEAINYGVKVTGATVHFVSEIPDGGKIIMQKAIYINKGDTPETLQKRVMQKAEWIILPRAIEKVCVEMLKNGGCASN